MKRLAKEKREDIAALATMKESEIDLTGIPERLDLTGAEIPLLATKGTAG
jgi:hypothetical protein